METDDILEIAKAKKEIIEKQAKVKMDGIEEDVLVDIAAPDMMMAFTKNEFKTGIAIFLEARMRAPHDSIAGTDCFRLAVQGMMVQRLAREIIYRSIQTKPIVVH